MPWWRRSLRLPQRLRPSRRSCKPLRRGPTQRWRCREYSKRGGASRPTVRADDTSPQTVGVLVDLDRTIGRLVAPAHPASACDERPSTPRGRMVIDAHLEDEIGWRAEADALHLLHVRRVIREGLADIVVAAEMLRRAGCPVSPLHRA